VTENVDTLIDSHAPVDTEAKDIYHEWMKSSPVQKVLGRTTIKGSQLALKTRQTTVKGNQLATVAS
jgi:hypothetical protein